jgi:hypothetical protein
MDSGERPGVIGGSSEGLGRDIQWLPDVTEFLSTFGGLKLQRLLTKAMEEEAFANLSRVLSDGDKARLLSCSGTGAAGWLTAIPYAASLTFTNEEFRLAALLRLGLDIPICAAAKKCICGNLMDSRGYHALSKCAKGGWWQARHDRLVDTVIDVFREAGFQVEKEVPGAFGSDKRRADVQVGRFVDGGVLLGDVSVTSVVDGDGAPRVNAAAVRGSACQACEQHKTSKYAARAQAHDAAAVAAADISSAVLRPVSTVAVIQQEAALLPNGVLFTPLVFETFGLMGPQLLMVLRKIANHVSLDARKRNGMRAGDFVQSFQYRAMQKLSVALQKGNVLSLVRKSLQGVHAGSGGNSVLSQRAFTSRSDPIIRPSMERADMPELN